MLPLCLIVGDSTAIGTADVLGAQGLQCAVHARVGASSSETVRTFLGSAPVERAVIALGSNDPTNPQLVQNLMSLRARIRATRVTWLAPYNARAANAVASIARAHGDSVIPLSLATSRDRVHPASYRLIAASLGWRASSGPRMALQPPPPARVAVRHAQVTTF